jgi:hypothetical protein
MAKKKARSKKATATKKKQPSASEPLKLIGRVVAEMCYLHSVSQSHDAKIMTILQDKGILSKDELEAYAGRFPVAKLDTFHFKFCEKKLAELGLTALEIKLIIEDLKRGQ